MPINSQTRSRVSQKTGKFTESVIREMTRLANRYDAINLSQGFPDFDGPKAIIDSVADAIKAGHNQYARSLGHLTRHPRLQLCLKDVQWHCTVAEHRVVEFSDIKIIFQYLFGKRAQLLDF